MREQRTESVPTHSRPTLLRVQDQRSPEIRIQVQKSSLLSVHAKRIPTLKADRPSREAYEHAAWFLDVDPRALRAVGEVEAGTAGGFNDDDTPVILFERHVFNRLTSGLYTGSRVPGGDSDWSLVSWPTVGGYGPPAVQHQRLAYAVTLDRDAALKSASWGLFQIMGENFRLAGFSTIQGFVNAMYESVDNHLRALVHFVWSVPTVLEALREKDWKELARYYNGPGYAMNKWDVKMAEAYERLA